MFIKKLIYHFMFTVLFIGAVYSTWSSITNLTLQDLKDSFASEVVGVNEMPSFQNPPEREQVLKHAIKREQKVSENSKTIDIMEDLQQFERKKVIATGYTAGIESTGKTKDHPQYGVTYSGVPVQRDVYSTIAADLDVFPLGTVLYIPNYGFGVVADIGGAIKGNKIDLYFHTVEDVYREWGRQEVEVFVIKRGDGTLTNSDLEKLNQSDTLQVFQFDENKPS